MAQFTVTVNQQVNQPPSVVGDGSATTGYGTTIVFVRADFTTNTTPPYSDPEGDAALNLRVTSLPSEGELQLSTIAVTLNQIIAFSDIDAGNFTYVPNNGNTTSYMDPWTFEIADAGSGQFVG